MRSKTAREATTTSLRRGRETATVRRRGSSRKSLSESANSRSETVAETTISSRSPPWKRSTVSMDSARCGSRAASRAFCARCGTTTPRPVRAVGRAEVDPVGGVDVPAEEVGDLLGDAEGAVERDAREAQSLQVLEDGEEDARAFEVAPLFGVPRVRED